MIEALEHIGRVNGLTVLDPSVVYLRFVDGPTLAYMPDCMWTYGRSSPTLIIFEVETNPAPKIVAGEVALSSMCGTSRALILQDSHPLGQAIRKPIVVPDLYDLRRKKRILPGTRVRLPRAEKVVFFLILENEECYDYYKRYVDVLARHRGLFHYCAVIWSDAKYLSGAIKSLSRDDEIRYWLK